jgi:hypothetical protein
MFGPEESVRDYLTGRELPYGDDEYIRQAVERMLVEDKGFPARQIEVDLKFPIELCGERREGRLDLLVRSAGRPFMALKCTRGSLVTREREALASSRLAFQSQVPLTVVTNGEDAELLDTASGKVLGRGLAAIPTLAEAKTRLAALPELPLPLERRIREERIYLAYQTFQCPAECDLPQV